MKNDFIEKVLNTNSHKIECIALSKSGAFVCTAKDDIIIWSLFELGKSVRLNPVLENCFMNCIQMTPDEKKIIVSCTDYKLRVYKRDGNFLSYAAINSIPSTSKIAIRVIDNETLIYFTDTGSFDLWKYNRNCNSVPCRQQNNLKEIYVIDNKKLAIIYKNVLKLINFNPKYSAEFFSSKDEINQVIFINNKFMAIEDRHKLIISSLLTNQIVKSIALSLTEKFVIAAAQNCEYAFYSCPDYSITALRVGPFSVAFYFYGHTSAVTSLYPLKNNKFLISTSDDKTVRLWNIEKVAQDFLLYTHKYSIKSLLFSECENYFSIFDQQNTMTLMTFQDNISSVIKSFTQVSSCCVKFIYGFVCLASNENATISVYSLLYKAIIHTLIGHMKKICRLEISFDDKYLISSSEDYTLRFWNVQLWTQEAIIFKIDANREWLTKYPEIEDLLE